MIAEQNTDASVIDQTTKTTRHMRLTLRNAARVAKRAVITVRFTSASTLLTRVKMNSLSQHEHPEQQQQQEIARSENNNERHERRNEINGRTNEMMNRAEIVVDMEEVDLEFEDGCCFGFVRGRNPQAQAKEGLACTHAWVGGGMGGWMAWMCGCMDAWMDAWMHG